MKVAIVDIETGGFAPNKNGLLSLSVRIVDLATQALIEDYHRLVIPTKAHEIDHEAFKLHGLTKDKLKAGGQSQSDVNLEALNVLARHGIKVIVAHNTKFAKMFCVSRLGPEWADFQWVCTLSDIRIAKGPHESTMTKLGARCLSLKALCQEYDIAMTPDTKRYALWDVLKLAPKAIDQIVTIIVASEPAPELPKAS